MTQLLKDKVLVISPKVPRPDMQSGDLRLSTILGILAKTYEISFVSTHNWPGDDIYISLLERYGIKVYSGPFALKQILESNRFTVAILEFFSTAEYFLDRIRILQPECRVVVDSVDVHYLRFKLKYDLTKDETDHAAYRHTKERELAVYRKADAVITVTSDDADALIREHHDITCEVVPNIHEICLNNATPERNTLVFVGGFAHPPNVDAVLYFCNDILPLIRHDKPDIHFTIVGSNPPDQIRLLENDFITVTGYVPETTSYLHRSHVSIAPLRYGAGMKGKIGEAMAHGVPVATTSVGAQGMGLTDRINVLIGDCPRVFADAVLELLDNSCLYETIRRNAIKIIDDNYTATRVAGTMITSLKKITEKRAKKMNFQDKTVFLGSYVAQKIKAKLCPG